MILIAISLITARRLNRKAEREATELEAYISLIGHIRLSVECFSLPISEILVRADEDLLHACGYDGEMPPRELEKIFPASGEGGEGVRIMKEFSHLFGRGYRDEQLRICDYCTALLEKKRNTLAAELPSRKKLNITLCVAAAAAAVILLI